MPVAPSSDDDSDTDGEAGMLASVGTPQTIHERLAEVEVQAGAEEMAKKKAGADTIAAAEAKLRVLRVLKPHERFWDDLVSQAADLYPEKNLATLENSDWDRLASNMPLVETVAHVVTGEPEDREKDVDSVS